MIGLPYHFETYTPENILHDHNLIVLGYLRNKEISHASTPVAGWHGPQYTIYRPEAYMLNPMTDFRHCSNVDEIHYSNAHSENEFKAIFDLESKIGGFRD
jgi:hypothetical protein